MARPNPLRCVAVLALTAARLATCPSQSATHLSLLFSALSQSGGRVVLILGAVVLRVPAPVMRTVPGQRLTVHQAHSAAQASSLRL